MRAYYLVPKHFVMNDQTLIVDEKNCMLYELIIDQQKRSWHLNTPKKEKPLVILSQGKNKRSIMFMYDNHNYIVKQSLWNQKFIVLDKENQGHSYRYFNQMFKGYFYINGIEQSYFDEDSSIISTSEDNSLFLLLIHLAVYIIMTTKIK